MRLPFLMSFFLICTLSAAEPALRLEFASLPQTAQAVSRPGSCIAPRFRDTVAAVTLFLTLGAAQHSMDLTRPLTVEYHAFGEQPAVRIIAYALPGGYSSRKSIRYQNVRFHPRRQGDLVLLETDGLTGIPPAVPPGETLRPGEILRAEATPDSLHRHFRFEDFNSRDPAVHLLLRGTDELLGELKRLTLSFSAEPEMLKLELTAVPRDDSALAAWMKRPPVPRGRIEVFSGAETLAVLRLPATETLRRYGKDYMEAGQKSFLPLELAAAANGFAVLSADSRRGQSAVRLAAGMSPSAAPGVSKALSGLGYTPFPGWYLLRRDPVLLVSAGKDEIIFCGMEKLERTLQEKLFAPTPYRGNVPDGLFVCLDLARPERPLALLRAEGGVLHLTLQASDRWFAAHGPLLDKPLLLPDRKPRY
ncbi:MAG: hypothetical protein J5806_14825 [Lentisphaeria bacterium]|nr:hypothetical protein [Lentisphaeria bacterium]